jgi:hypothetical protein
MKPDHARNIDFVGQCDPGEHGGGLQVMINKGFAYVSHPQLCGINIIDVRDARHPKQTDFVPATPGTTAGHIQAHDDLLIVANRPKGRFPIWDPSILNGVQICDISRAGKIRQIGFLPIEGLGCHRLWYDGGRYAYGSIHWNGFTDHVFAVIDLADPTKPELAGRWWLPGMNQAAGETPTWKNGRMALHHALVVGDLAYCAWRDGCLVMLDIGNRSAPKLLCHRAWSPPFPGGTHSPLPLPDRNLLVMGDEATEEGAVAGIQRSWIFDVREPSNPVSIATMPVPDEEDYFAKGGKFGMHNFHENRVGSLQSSTLIFCAHQNAGLRVWNIADSFHPKNAGHFVPPPPPRPITGQKPIVNVNDVYVMPDGLMFVSDASHGLMVLQYKG